MGNSPTCVCEKCGGINFDKLVRHGSYIIRCSNCHNDLAATSWIAAGPRLEGVLRVFRDGQETGEPLIEGAASEIWREIGSLAEDVTTLILR